MSNQQEPSSLSEKVKRLEEMFLMLLFSRNEDRIDEDLWFDLRHIFRKYGDRDYFDNPSIYHLLERINDRRSNTKTESLKNKVNKIQHDVKILMERTDAVQIETHSLLAIQALGLQSEKIKLTRYIPVRVYIDKTPVGVIEEVSVAINGILSKNGLSVADEFPEIKASWFKKWFAKSKDLLTLLEIIELLKKFGVEISLVASTINSTVIHTPEGNITQVKAIGELIKAIENVPNAALQVGPILLIKVTPVDGVPYISVRTLSQKQLVEIENNPLQLKNPSQFKIKLDDEDIKS